MTFLRICKPYSNYNNCLRLSHDQRKMLYAHEDKFVNKKFVDLEIVGSTNDNSTRFHAPFLTKSLVYVITETVGEYPYPYFSEKTWRAFNTGCAFMMINARHSLAKLQEFGFLTFGQFWDESYDTLDNCSDRIDAVVNELLKLQNLSVTDYEQMRKEMLPILEHNIKRLEAFSIEDYDNIAKSL